MSPASYLSIMLCTEPTFTGTGINHCFVIITIPRDVVNLYTSPIADITFNTWMVALRFSSFNNLVMVIKKITYYAEDKDYCYYCSRPYFAFISFSHSLNIEYKAMKC